MRNCRIFFLVAAMGLLAACVKEQPANEGATLEVGIAPEITPETKIYMGVSDGTSRKLYWSDGDAIAVNGNASDPLSGISEGVVSARFHFSAPLASAPFNLLYPASIWADASHVTLPATQSWKADGFADGSYPMAGYSTDGSSLELNHLCAVVKVSVVRSPAAEADLHNIESVTFKGRNNEQVSGTFSINYSAATLSGSSAESADKQVAVTHSQSIKSGLVATYYIVVPARAYSNGFDLRIQDASGDVMTSSYTGSITLAAGKLYSMNDIQFEPTESGAATVTIGSAQDLINFATAYNNKDFQDVSNLSVAVSADLSFDAGKSAAFNATGGIGLKADYGDAEDFYFNGIFNGNGHTISGLEATVALFKATGSDGTVKDLTLDSSCSFTFTHPNTAEANFGAVADYHKGTLKDVTVNADVALAAVTGIGQATDLGGIAGRITTGVIDGCSYGGTLSVPSGFSCSTYLRIGGLVGRISNSEGIIKDSSFDGLMNFAGVDGNTNTAAPRLQIGGILGCSNGATVSDCTVNAHPTGIDKTVTDDVSVNTDGMNVTLCLSATPNTQWMAVGGVVGFNMADASVSGCINNAPILVNFNRKSSTATQELHFGGIVGMNLGDVSSSQNNARLDGRSDIYTQKIGGVAGYNAGAITSCSNLTPGVIEIGGAASGAYGAYDLELGGVIGAQTSAGNSYGLSNAAPVSVYRIANNAATVLKMGGVYGVSESDIDGTYGAISNSGKVYEYNNNTKQATLGFFQGGIVGLAKASVANVTNNGMQHFNQIRAYVISVTMGGVVGKLESSSAAELINCINEAEVYYQIPGKNTTDNRIGGVLGSCETDVAISGCSNSGKVWTSNGDTSVNFNDYSFYLGGIAGYLAGASSVSLCSNTGYTFFDLTNNTDDDVTKIAADGGIVGVAKGTSTSRINISDCSWIYDTGTAVGSRRGTCGGIVAYAEYANVSGCEVEVQYNKYNHVTGGIVGWAKNSNITGCAFRGTKIAATQAYVNGGIVAKLHAGSVVDGCYNYCTDITTAKAATVRGEIAAVSESGTTIQNCHHTGTISICSDSNYTDGGGNVADL